MSFCLVKRVFLMLTAGFLCQISWAQTTEYPIIPYPTTLVEKEGQFTITAKTNLSLAKNAALFANEANQLKDIIKNATGITLSSKKSKGGSVILFQQDPGIANPEGYHLTITPELVTITAKTPAGMFRAIQTLRQLLPVKASSSQSVTIPAAEIKDEPLYTWRGMHLDVSRHFFSVEYLKKYIDLLALYKMNKLHLHLTDDQGWRIEIKKYPKLTEQGAWRTFNNQDSTCMKRAKDNPDFEIDTKHIVQKDGKTMYGGFYTQQQMKDIIAFAAARHIEIIPEIDMPGHMMAAIKAYPYLSCSGNTGWGKDFSTPICPCNEATYQFAQDVYSEIIDLFPSEYVHLGADEVEKTSWAQADVCKELMQKEGIKNVNELQSYFVHRMEKFFHSKGKKLIGWDEILEGGINPSAIVMYWRSWVPQAPIKAAKNGNQVIMTPGTPLYFDSPPDKNSVYNVYHFQVIPKGLSEAEGKAIIGAQANMWTEYIPSEKRADYMFMPRMTALAEVLWTHKDLYKSYQSRLIQHYGRLETMGVHYRIPDLTGFTGENVFTDQAVLTVQKPLQELTIRYTTDGSLPQATSSVLPSSLTIKTPSTIKVAAFTQSGSRGDIYPLSYKQETYAEPASVANPVQGLQCTYYPEYFLNTTQIKTKKAAGTSVVKTVVVPQEATAGSFGLTYRGYLNIPETGVYSFYLTCDDGGVLRVAGREVVNNDGQHSAIEKSGQVALKKGLQPIEIDFIEGGGGYALKLQYSLGNETPKDIPASWLVQPQNK
ncbi:family 20 glycosylhydrolase [Cytophagaceae bacterium YF14B1]|uniref:beta-N-acetylhexosaminidase n=1 Tax=Xanthocytophaga flava TaxID=3048013 RepID=A0AAE3UC76_9BACT|nr:family 20 glycosylhydrolase [Xanthocytophaga flavus]MDJ1485193.1 family 20 glycosylhydrolase [Xanthocytophaga flavus]